MTVSFKDGAATLNFSFSITTAVVSHDPTKNVDTSRWQKTDNTRTNPTQFPNGIHLVDSAKKTSNPKYGETWLTTSVSQVLKGENGKNVRDYGYFIHFTPTSNTNGCVGVPSKEDMEKIMSLYEANKATTDNRTLIIVQGGPLE